MYLRPGSPISLRTPSIVACNLDKPPTVEKSKNSRSGPKKRKQRTAVQTTGNLEGRHTSAIRGTERGNVGVLEGRDDVDETGPLARVRQAVALGDKIRAKAVIFFKLVRVSIGISEAVRRTDGGVYGIWGMRICLPAGSNIGGSVGRNGGMVIKSRRDQGAATKRVGEEIKTVEDHRAPEDRPGQE
ncbi:hypothetical protein B0H14DRAFT_2620566 [Mycena olivaceomarginata]|nr:hypothetical protein B0H14DRAFT_2620566 [Mycena olivaceomarginata]